MTFYNGRIRPKPGSAEFGMDPLMEGPTEFECDLLTEGQQIIGATAGTLQGEPSVALFSDGELRVLRYRGEADRESKQKQGKVIYDKLNEAEVKAVESAGLKYGHDTLIGITQTVVAGPVTLLDSKGDVFELPWKDMSKGKQHHGTRKNFDQPIAEIRAAWDKTVARTRSGQIWFWQAGKNPAQVEIPVDEEVMSINAGGRLGVALTKSNRAWAWVLGRSDVGQEQKTIAGVGAEYLPGMNDTVKASKMEVPADVNLQTLSVGPSHVAVASADGTWYTAGDGRYGQLGVPQETFNSGRDEVVERGDEFAANFAAMDLNDLVAETVIGVVCGATMTWIQTVEKA